MARIAVVGSGISGLACAALLRQSHDVILYESETRPGGHSRTLHIPGALGSTAVDTGFIVYNEINYPLLTKMFAAYEIATKPSDMSFGVRYGDGDLEFCASSLSGLFAQKKNAFSPRYLKMLADIVTFFRKARGVLDDTQNPSLGEFIDSLRLGSWFRDRFLVPMGAAIWSTPPDRMMHFPAKTFVRFFDNHGLLSISGHHPWRTVVGGSEQYVKKISEQFGSRLRVASPVVRVEKSGQWFEVRTKGGHSDAFDEVVFASHADASLAMIADPTAEERAILGAFTFTDNTAVLHRDDRLMPRAKAAWASWVYAAGSPKPGGPDTCGPNPGRQVSLTYWMNRLQSLPGENLFVSLNPDRPVADRHFLDRYIFRHPVFTPEAVAAQDKIPSIQGARGLWFCGAWQRNGFHEDGLWSAVRVAEAKGVAVPWK